MSTKGWCDLVLEGGGVKGIALVGAIEELRKAGYEQCRVAGTSAGAIVGSLVAAGIGTDDLLKTMNSLSYKKFRDEGWIDRLGLGGKSFSLVIEKGIYEGEYLRQWLASELEKLNVRTFAQLKITEDWGKQLPPKQRYKLVVVVSDISSGRMVRLPWDYHKYGLDPDEQLVADAVRASMSIPFFYEPVKLKGHYLVDGGMLSNFPINLFDSIDDWPTFGIKLSARPDANQTANKVGNVIDFTKAIIGTATNAHDQMHIDDPCTQKRTIFVDTGKVKATDFGISKASQNKLYKSGKKAARDFLKSWDYARYKQAC